MERARFRLPELELPDTRIVPKDLFDLLDIGKQTWDVELYGKNWKLRRLEEWETREIVRKVANLDVGTKMYLQRVETLFRAIVEIIRLDKDIVYSFDSADEKVILRHLLLAMDPYLLTQLYEAYNLGSQQLEEVIKKQFPGIQEVVKKDFFGLGGESSEPSTSKIPKTKGSGKS